MLGVLLAIKRPIFSQGLRKVLEAAEGLSVHGEVHKADQVIPRARLNGWALLLLDLALPGRDPLDLLVHLREEFQTRKFLVLYDTPDTALAVRAYQLGAEGTFPKDGEPAELLAAVHRVLRGGRYLCDGVAASLPTVAARKGESITDLLSDREFQVFRALSKGQRLSDISKDLCVGLTTVSTYRTRICEKLGVSSNVEIARLALQYGVIQ